MEPLSQQTTYVLTSDDRISYVDDGWVRFAAENGAPQLQYDSVVGTNLWDFIDGSGAQEVYRHLLSDIRRLRRTHHFHYRCDSPECLRVFEMFITPLDDGRLHLESRLVFQKPRPPIQLMCAVVERDAAPTHICSICKKVEMARHVWVELEQADEMLKIHGVSRLPLLVHGMCPECPQRILLN